VEWRLYEELDGVPTAVIEMARAAGRALLPHPGGDEVMLARTTGVGQLLLAARDAGARRIVVGLGGSATTDGGLGAYRAVGSPDALAGTEVIVACDVVTVAFTDAARRFSPQKGATVDQVRALTGRLIDVAELYRRETGVDVTMAPGAGAAGGLAGGLLALGARLASGFDVVARLLHLPERMASADLVVTGEGHVDPPSFEGKVPGGVLALARARQEGPVPVLCIAGDVDDALLTDPPPGLDLVSLTERFGGERAWTETSSLVAAVTAEALARF
jgi:glycerate kinase